MQARSTLWCVCTAMLVCACTGKEDVVLTDFQEGELVTITSLPLPGDASAAPNNASVAHRVHIGTTQNQQTPLLWGADDKIRVFSTVGEGGSGFPSAEFDLVSGEGTATATFQGTMPGNCNSYIVFSPYAANQYATQEGRESRGYLAYSLGGISLQQTQSYVEDGIADGLMPMVGWGNRNGFTMTPLGAIVRIDLKSTAGRMVTSVRLADGSTSTVLTGAALYGYSWSQDGALEVGNASYTNGQYEAIVAKNGGFELGQTPVSVSFVVFAPVTLTNPTFYVLTDQGTVSRTFSGHSHTIDRNGVLTIRPSGGAYDIDTWTK